MNGDGAGRRNASPVGPISLVGLTVAFIAGIAVERWSFTSVSAAAATGGTAFLFAFQLAGLPRRSPLRFSLVPMMLFLSLGFASARLSQPQLPFPPGFEPFFERPQTLFLAEVDRPPDFYPDKVRLALRLRKAFLEEETLAVDGGVLLTLKESRRQWLEGDRILLRLTLNRFHNFDNPGGYDYERAQAEQGLYARANAPHDGLLIKVEPEWNGFPTAVRRLFTGPVDRFRQHGLDWLQENMKPETASFYAALLLGYRHQVPKPWQEHLSRVGVTHLLAISGLHLGLIGMAAFWLSRYFLRYACPRLLQRTSDQHVALWAALAAAVLYALVSGLALPTWRAALMLLLSFTAFHLYRSPDPMHSLAAAALLILVIHPLSLWQISFQLSFAAMLGLFIIYPRLDRFRILSGRRNGLHPAWKALSPFEHAFWVSMAVNILVLPLIAYHFHGVSLAGFIANSVLVPFVGFLVLPLGLTGLLLLTVHEYLAFPVMAVGGWFLERCLDLIAWFSHLPWAFFWVGEMPFPYLVWLYATLALILCPFRWWKKIAGLAALTLVIGGLIARENHPAAPGEARHLEATFVDVGQGSSTLLTFPGGETMLIDGGGFFDDSFDIGRNVLAPFLWHEGVRKLDYVVLSHDHPDHRNGLRFILEHFNVGAFWESGVPQPAEGWNSLRAIASRRRIPVRNLPQIFGEHEIGPCRLRILHPDFAYIDNAWDGEDLNEVSLVVQVDYGATHLIAPGDIGRSVERRLFGDSTIDGRVLLVSPHHGSARSNSELLLDRLHPVAIVFSCGHDNWLGLPAAKTINRCMELDIPVYRTDQHGAIRAVSDGSRWELKNRGIEKRGD